MDDDNILPATENFISSFLREEAKSFYAQNNVADAADSNLFSSSDQHLLQILNPMIHSSNFGIKVPVSSDDSSDSMSSPSQSRSRSSSPRSRVRDYLLSYFAADNTPWSQTVERRQIAGNICTLADISGGTDRNSDETQEYYVGGSQSGTIVLYPKERDDVDKKSDAGSSSRRTCRIVSDHDEPQSQAVTIWRNGFTVNDGPLKILDNSQDGNFIDIVQSLESREGNKIHVDLKLIMRLEEDFMITPFHGVGRRLTEPNSVSTEPPASSDSLTTTTPPPPSVVLVLDPAAPTTWIQLRLADRTRLVSRFNTNHTVRDVRGFIDESRPGGSKDYQLVVVGCPLKPLLDFDQTIEDAGVSNSVLIQKF